MRITTRRVSEGTQCITGWSLAHASGCDWNVLICRTPRSRNARIKGAAQVETPPRSTAPPAVPWPFLVGPNVGPNG